MGLWDGMGCKGSAPQDLLRSNSQSGSTVRGLGVQLKGGRKLETCYTTADTLTQTASTDHCTVGKTGFVKCDTSTSE